MNGFVLLAARLGVAVEFVVEYRLSDLPALVKFGCVDLSDGGGE